MRHGVFYDIEWVVATSIKYDYFKTNGWLGILGVNGGEKLISQSKQALSYGMFASNTMEKVGCFDRYDTELVTQNITNFQLYANKIRAHFLKIKQYFFDNFKLNGASMVNIK